jgi:hypothetical protein
MPEKNIIRGQWHLPPASRVRNPRESAASFVIITYHKFLFFLGFVATSNLDRFNYAHYERHRARLFLVHLKLTARNNNSCEITTDVNICRGASGQLRSQLIQAS